MHRFYLPSPAIKNKNLTISDNRIVHQAGRVLRMRSGDELCVFDENGKELLARITDINKRRIEAEIVKPVKNKSEAGMKVDLYQAIPKKPALFELVVQKATEIGVSEIYPLITERTENRRMAKFDRLSTIAMEAAEQSGRTKIPVIHHPVNFDEVVSRMKNGYIGYEYETKKYLSDYDFSGKKDAQIIIGPEGGLSATEMEICKKAGVRPFTFGPRILRTETAAIAALSLVLLRK